MHKGEVIRGGGLTVGWEGVELDGEDIVGTGRNVGGVAA